MKKHQRKKTFPVLLAVLCGGAVLMAGCSPAVGSKEWCEEMKAKPKGDWTGNELSDFAKHCVL
jgi:hypothetical protein